MSYRYWMLAGCLRAAGCVGGGDAGQRKAGLANPASVYCVQSGYRLELRTGAGGGQYGVCLFPDGTECEEWAFFRSECGAGRRSGPASRPAGQTRSEPR